MVEKVYYATKGHSLQIKREDNDVNIIFELKHLGQSGVVMQYNL